MFTAVSHKIANQLTVVKHFKFINVDLQDRALSRPCYTGQPFRNAIYAVFAQRGSCSQSSENLCPKLRCMLHQKLRYVTWPFALLAITYFRLKPWFSYIEINRRCSHGSLSVFNQEGSLLKKQLYSTEFSKKGKLLK